MLDMLKLLQMQLDLQTGAMSTGDPTKLEDAERCWFIMWNAYALCDEVHEATGEAGWKPWASSRHVNEDAFLKEMVDALHFWLNMCLAGAPRGWSLEQTAHALASGYATKHAENARRQREGYDGVSSKCPNCRREREETAVTVEIHGLAVEHCPCGHVWREEPA